MKLVIILRSMVLTPGVKQLLRYAVAGFAVTQFAACVYVALAALLHVEPLVANCFGTACGLGAGYWTHSRWSFASGAGNGEMFQVTRFLLVSLIAFLVNSAWVWILVSTLRLPAVAPVPIMLFVTPWLSFVLNRHWVFRAQAQSGAVRQVQDRCVPGR